MIKFFFRTAFFLIGSWLAYHFGSDVVKPLYYKMTGEQVVGRVEGFLVGRNQSSIQLENSGVRYTSRMARRPVFRYPVVSNSRDSVSSRNGSGVMYLLFQYELNDKVPVVFPKNNPQDGYIWGFISIFVSFLLFLFGLYMAYVGVARNKKIT